MRYLAGLRTNGPLQAAAANLLAVPAYLLLMTVALVVFVVMSRDARRPQR